MNEFSRSIAEEAYLTCLWQQKYERNKTSVSLGQFDRAIDHAYAIFVDEEIMEWATIYYDVFEDEELVAMWWVVERELFRLVERGEVFSFRGIQSIEGVAISLATRTVVKMRREQRFPEVDLTEQDLLDFLGERGQQQQLSLF